MVDSQNPYAAPQADLTPPPPPGAPWLQNLSPSLTKTGWGLGLIYYGIVAILLCGLIMGLSVAFRHNGIGDIIRIGAVIGILLGSLFLFLGPFFCLAVPAESGAKGFVIGSVLLQFPGILYAVAFQIMPQVPPAVLNVTVQILGLLSFLLFVLFMRRLATFIGRPDFTRRARNILIGFAVLITLGVAFAITLYMRLMSIDIAIMFPLVIGILVVFVMYANLVNDLRKSAGRKVANYAA